MIVKSKFKCKCCGINKIDYHVIELCKLIEYTVGFPLNVNSGYRCRKHNTAIGGAKNSQHLKGFAADLSGKDLSKLKEVCKNLWDHKEIGGYGIYRTFVHVDMGKHRTWKG